MPTLQPTSTSNTSPHISIVVPAYNVAPYLPECLDSLLAQTYPHWECICVNDGSTDNTGNLLNQYAKRDRRIHVIHQPHCGVSAARNRALNLVHGSYITFLDGDDLLDPHWFAMAATAITRYNAPEMITFACQYVDENLQGRTQPNPNAINTPIFHLITHRDCIFTFWQASRCDCQGMCTRFVHHNLINSLRFDTKLTIGEDTVFVWDLMTRINSCLAIDYKGYLYRTRKTSAMHMRFSSLSSVLTGQITRLQRIFTYYKTYKKNKSLLGLCPLFGYSTFYWHLIRLRLKCIKTLPHPEHTHLKNWIYNNHRYPLEFILRYLFLRLLYLLLKLIRTIYSCTKHCQK